MQTTFFYLERFLKKLVDDQYSSITKGSIYYSKHMYIQPFSMEVDWWTNGIKWMYVLCFIFVDTAFLLCGQSYMHSGYNWFFDVESISTFSTLFRCLIKYVEKLVFLIRHRIDSTKGLDKSTGCFSYDSIDKSLWIAYNHHKVGSNMFNSKVQKIEFHCFVEWFNWLFYNNVLNISVIQCMQFKKQLNVWYFLK